MIEKEQIESLIELSESIDGHVKTLRNIEFNTNKLEELLVRLNENIERQNAMFEILLENVRLLGK